jgi:nickel-dependent lactate racemase
VPPQVPDEPAALRAALRQPIQSPPLAALVHPGDRVVIAHSDITRATPNDRILPVLLAELEAAGVRRQDITLLNALGTHRRQTPAILGNGRCHIAHVVAQIERRVGTGARPTASIGR